MNWSKHFFIVTISNFSLLFLFHCFLRQVQNMFNEIAKCAEKCLAEASKNGEVSIESVLHRRVCFEVLGNRRFQWIGLWFVVGDFFCDSRKNFRFFTIFFKEQRQLLRQTEIYIYWCWCNYFGCLGRIIVDVGSCILSDVFPWLHLVCIGVFKRPLNLNRHANVLITVQQMDKINLAATWTHVPICVLILLCKISSAVSFW